MTDRPTEDAATPDGERRFEATASRGDLVRQILLRGGPLIALAVLVAALSLVSPFFLTVDNIFNILRQSAFVAMLAIGQTFVILTGGIDLSVAAIAALAACVAAVLMTQPGEVFGIAYGPFNPVLAIVIGLAVGVIAGAFNGLIIARFGIPDFIATLGAMTLLRGLALLTTGGFPIPSFRAEGGLSSLPDFLIWIGTGSVLGFPVSALIALIMAAVAWWVLRYTSFGRSVYAVGGNREAARISGISIGRVKIMVYAISGLCAGIAGLIMTGRLSSANALLGEGGELQSIASVVIGGTNLFGGEGGVLGSVIGALIIGVLNNGLNLLDVSPFWQRVVQGVVIILVVVLDQWRRNRMKTR
ncbi:ABC transporter permease [Bauldia sp.]|uniref:ABC transporter permease n=1 Tax=Bauldia sp. TaxID=2575872 RepID=UPI003BAD411C